MLHIYIEQEKMLLYTISTKHGHKIIRKIKLEKGGGCF